MLKFLKLLKSSQKEHRSDEANSKSKIIAKKYPVRSMSLVVSSRRRSGWSKLPAP